MYIPVLDSIERNIDNTGWWVWIRAVTERFLPFERWPYLVPDREYAD